MSVALMLFAAMTSTSSVATDFRGQVFIRAREARTDGSDWERTYQLTRVRLTVELRYGDVFGAVIEPDFAGSFCSAAGAVCADAEVSDAYIELRPTSILDLRFGHAKTPFGAIESMSEWRLPVQRDGLVSDVASDRLGFGGRRLGVRARIRLKDVAWKPSIELGGYADSSVSNAEDAALRIGARPIKGLTLELAGYARANGKSGGKYALASALAATFDRDGWFAILEGEAGTARLLRRDGVDTGTDSTFIGARAIGAYAIPLDMLGEWELEPYAGFDLFDPNTDTRDDRGYGIRGGVNVHWQRRIRAGLEAERRDGESAFVEAPETVFSLFLGVSLEMSIMSSR